MPDGQTPPPHAARQQWMALLARAHRDELEDAWSILIPQPAYTLLRKPEVGLAMVRGRAGGTGNPFNLGEMTLTRCAVRLDSEPRTIGVSYISGRDTRHAELAAAFDALLQTPQRAMILEDVLLPGIRQRLDAARRTRASESAATRVDFFTLVREQDNE